MHGMIIKNEINQSGQYLVVEFLDTTYLKKKQSRIKAF